MSIKLVSLYLLFILPVLLIAQQPDHCKNAALLKSRGIYVNEFFNFTVNDKIDEEHSILGVDADKDGRFEKEDSLLSFLKNHQFNLMILYDLSNVLNNRRMSYNGSSLEKHLERFIRKSKTQYGITQVGAAIGSFALPQSRSKINKIHNKYSCEINSQLNNFELGRDTLNNIKQEKFDQLRESVKLIKQVYNYNHPLHAKKNDNTRIIDRIIPEYEFWNYPDGYGGSADNKFRDLAYKDFEELLRFSRCVKAKSVYPLFIDVYLGHLGLDNFDDVVQARFIDKMTDRLYLSAYHYDPDTMFQFVKKRLALFGNPLNGTKPVSEVYVIFSAESLDCIKENDPYNANWNHFLGSYLSQKGSISCAENLFQTDYNRNLQKESWDNRIEGYLWFNYTVLRRNCRTVEKRLEVVR